LVIGIALALVHIVYVIFNFLPKFVTYVRR